MNDWLDHVLSLLLVANIVPILPVVLDVVEPVPRERRRRVLLSALLVGNVTAVAFVVTGGSVLQAMGSDINDVRVAGGLVLLVFAIFDLLFSREQRKEPLSALNDDAGSSVAEVGLVPLGVPMMVGPATLAAALYISEAHGVLVATFALLVNGLVNGALLISAEKTVTFVGRGVVRTIGKVFGLLLAAMAVSMIRAGVTNMVAAQ
ncbi:MAG: MarC family protein [Planctomycetota bacterium]